MGFLVPNMPVMFFLPPITYTVLTLLLCWAVSLASGKIGWIAFGSVIICIVELLFMAFELPKILWLGSECGSGC